MALLGRIFVVIFSFVFACLAAALVMTLAIVLPDRVISFDDPGAYQSFAVVVGLAATLFSVFAMFPAMIIIAIAEGLRLRSVLFYTIAGGALALVATFGWEFAGTGAGPKEALGSGREMLAAAGILAGFFYWLLAGRNAGKWRPQRSS